MSETAGRDQICISYHVTDIIFQTLKTDLANITNYIESGMKGSAMEMKEKAFHSGMNA